MPKLESCDCEHVSHFEVHTNHLYSKLFPAEELTNVMTPYGVYRVCKECAKTCLSKYKEIE
jgi:hypothetical protein